MVGKARIAYQFWHIRFVYNLRFPIRQSFLCAPINSAQQAEWTSNIKFYENQVNCSRVMHGSANEYLFYNIENSATYR
jgi:hypothetical protein